ncbi:MAG TPA: alpha/beta hydrolase, partial [Archaeoglobus veneficus]|nr:alpha/beta hydrolase [Archaeoglobus veneficus]
MEVSRVEFESLDGKEIPAFFVDSKSSKAALIIHGYASSKNEMLGFGCEIAEKGYNSYIVDLRGHGENENVFDENVIYDVNGVIKKLKEKYGKIITIGHS